MPMTIETSLRSNVLYVSATGEFTLAEAKRTFLELIGAVEKFQSEKILFDGRAITGNPTFVERFYYGEFAAESILQLQPKLGHGRNPRFAYVLEHPVLDPERLGETIAINRGANVKAFETMNDAIEWLDTEQDEPYP